MIYKKRKKEKVKNYRVVSEIKTKKEKEYQYVYICISEREDVLHTIKKKVLTLFLNSLAALSKSVLITTCTWSNRFNNSVRRNDNNINLRKNSKQ